MRNRLLQLLLVSAVLSSPALGQPVRTFVSTTGSDADPCSRSLPCRNFEAAITAVIEGGEVVVLDTGGFGPATITKSVALIAPRGLHAAIAPTSGSAIHVNAANNDVVTLRNLYLKSQGGLVGINLDGAESLALDEVTIEGFGVAGLDSDSTIDRAISVTDCVFRGNSLGMDLFASAARVFVIIHRSAFIDHAGAVFAHSGSRVTIRDSVFQQFSEAITSVLEGNSNSSEVTAHHCTFSHFPGGAMAVKADGGANGLAVVTLVESTITHTFVGARAYQNGTVRLFRSVITRSGTGLDNTGQLGATIETDGACMVDGNTTNTAGTIDAVTLQ